jgi:hypothetical protein
MRNMSFSATTAQFRARTKTVTRRLGWAALKPGMVVMAVEKAQGLKKGEHVVKLGPIRITEAWPEPLDVIDQADVIAEGFPELTTEQFVHFFCEYNGCTPDTIVNRIAFEYITTTNDTPSE